MMGSAHKAVSVAFRMFELASAAVILGLLAKFFNLLFRINGPTDPRLVYAVSMACISIALACLLAPPLRYSFYAFPIDFALFVCWIVCFALLVDLTGTRTCTSSWFERYWTVYWDADSGTNVVVTGSGCSKWRAVLCFTFLISMLWLLSGFLGLYACMKYHNLGTSYVSFMRRFVRRKKSKDGGLEQDRPHDERLPQVGHV